MSYTRVVILVGLLALSAGCGGDLTRMVPEASAAQPRAASWDPLAASIDTTPLLDALSQVTYKTQGAYSFTALTVGNLVDNAVLDAISLEEQSGAVVVRSSQELDAVGLYIRYDSAAQHMVEVELFEADAVGMSLLVEPGLLALGVAATGGSSLSPEAPLAIIHLATGEETAVRRIAAISQVAATAVRDLDVAYDGGPTATLSWHERHTGDYNLDGEVNISDITPVGFYWQKKVVEGAPDWAEVEVVDGNEDTEINIIDLTPIGQNFRSFITGYNVYRKELASPDEEPTPEDAGWVKVESSIDPSGPSASREGMFNNQKTRLAWTFIDEPAAPGYYAWYVAPTGKPEETPYEGLPGNVAKAGGVPDVGLSFEIQPPASELLNVGQDLYLGIKVENVENLFSANVRFEYNASLVEFVEAVAFYTEGVEHVNLLTDPGSPDPPEENPLFIGADVGESQSGGDFRQVGFNATRKQGEPTVSGDGFLGYVKFHTIADTGGGSATCFRFPQVSTFIYLWGVNYGVPVANPTLGMPQIVNIAE